MFQFVNKISDPATLLQVSCLTPFHNFESSLFPFIIAKSATHYSLVNLKKATHDAIIMDPSSNCQSALFFIKDNP